MRDGRMRLKSLKTKIERFLDILLRKTRSIALQTKAILTKVRAELVTYQKRKLPM